MVHGPLSWGTSPGVGSAQEEALPIQCKTVQDTCWLAQVTLTAIDVTFRSDITQEFHQEPLLLIPQPHCLSVTSGRTYTFPRASASPRESYSRECYPVLWFLLL